MKMEKRSGGKMRKVWKIVLIILAVVVVVRLILPYVVLRYANQALAEMPGYRGQIHDIDLALIRGAYRIDSIYLNKHDSVSGKETKFFGARAIDLSIEWRSLLHGEVVSEIVFEKPYLLFTRDKVEPETLKEDSTDFIELLEDLMPIKVNRFEVINGTISYRDLNTTPKVDVAMTDTYIVATNLRNAYDSSAVLPATIKARATVYEGDLELNLKLNPMARVPTFDLNAELSNTNLVLLNDFFEAYANVDVSRGTLGLYTEIAAAEGKFDGYVKPLLHDLNILGKEDKEDSFFKKMWEGLVGTAGQVVENLKEEQVATKIPFEGDVESPDANVWYTISYVLRNAFIQAIQPSIDNEINLADATKEDKEEKGFLERIFGKKDEDKKEKEDKEKG